MKQKNSTETDLREPAEGERRDERLETLRAADLVVSERRTPVACLVKDVSKTGLKLLYDSPFELPKQIKVILHHPSEVLHCEVVWQREKEIGLRILGVE